MSFHRYLRTSIFAIIVIFVLFGSLVSCDTKTSFNTYDLSISKTASPDTFTTAGEIITYTYVIRAPYMRTTLNGLAVTDDKIGKLTCNSNKITDNATVTCTGEYVVTEADIVNSEITNKVVAKKNKEAIKSYPNSCGGYDLEEYFDAKGETSLTIPYAPPPQEADNTPPPTEPPLVEPVELEPVLDGTVPYCDSKTKAMNLRLDPGAESALVQEQLASGEMEITIGGLPAVCEVPASNTSLVSSIPDLTIVFPAQVEVIVNGYPANDFAYDGQGCAPKQPTGGDGGVICIDDPLGDPVCP